MTFGLLTLVYPFALIYAAASDMRAFRIPNWVSLLLAGAYAPIAFLAGTPTPEIAQGLVLGFTVLAAGFGLFAVRVIGGGDAKLLAATSVWVGHTAILNFLIIMGLAGALLSVALLSFRAIPIQPFYVRIEWLMRLHEARAGAPYGLAIAVAGVAVFPQTRLFAYAFGL